MGTFSPLQGPLPSTFISPKFMHLRHCTISGCPTAVRSRYSPYCQGHRRALGRHGHPEQTALKVAELAPWLKIIRTRQAENAGSEAWAILRGRWQAMVDSAVALQSQSDAGYATARTELSASRLVREVAAVTDADTVVREVMAVGMLGAHNPRLFRSDKAARFQMARRLLALIPKPRYYSHATRKARTARVDHPARVMDLLSARLWHAFAGAAGQLFSIEQRREPAEMVEQRKLAAALEALQGTPRLPT